MKRIVFEDRTDVVRVGECRLSRVYVLKERNGDLYKLHQGNKLSDPFIWCSLSDSHYNRNGDHDTFEKALLSARLYGEVYEFESIRDFAQWLAKGGFPMNTQRLSDLSSNLKSIKTACFYNPNWAFIGFKTDFHTVIKECVIRPGGGGLLGQMTNDLNEAIKPVLEKYAAIVEEEIKKEVSQ